MLDPEDKRIVKENFNEWLDTTDQRKELTKQVTEIRKRTATVLDIEPTKVTKLFNHLKKLYSSGTDELSELKEIVEQIS